MTNETATIVIAGAILAGRLWSMFEHKKTGKEVNQIRIYFNGEMEKKLEEAREEGRREERERHRKDLL